MFNINEFKQNGLVAGGARPSLFKVLLTPPGKLGLQQNLSQQFSFVCRAAELPASEVASFDIPYFGRKVKLAGDRTFADWRVTVMNDEDFRMRSMFEYWSNSINSMESNIRYLTAESYKSPIQIYQYSKDGNIIRGYDMVGAFPTVVDAISVDWNSTNQIEEFTVTFSYDYWLPLDEISDITFFNDATTPKTID